MCMTLITDLASVNLRHNCVRGSIKTLDIGGESVQYMFIELDRMRTRILHGRTFCSEVR